MERLIEADNPALIAAYEEQVRKLQSQRIRVQEKLADRAPPPAQFEETYSTAMGFIENPGKLWASDELAERRLVPKLLFGGHMLYRKGEGYRTAAIARPFGVLRVIEGGKSDLVGPAGLEPATRPL